MGTTGYKTLEVEGKQWIKPEDSAPACKFSGCVPFHSLAVTACSLIY